MVIEVPNAKVGTQTPQSKILAIDETMITALKGKPVTLAYFPQADGTSEIAELRTFGVFGDLETKSNRKFVGYAAFVMIQSTQPQDQVDRAAAQAASDFYQVAKRNYKLVPASQLREKQQ